MKKIDIKFKKMINSLKSKIKRLIKICRKNPVKSSLFFVVTATFISLLLVFLLPIIFQKSYSLGTAESLLTSVDNSMAKKLKYDSKKQLFTFNNGSSSTSESAQTGAQQITATAYADAKKGISVTDSVNKIDFSLTPKYNLANGKKNGNRVVYPLSNSNGWTVYTMQGTGVKEDIILSHYANKKEVFEYKLGLGDGLEARLESDGSIGVYGNTVLNGNVTTSTSADAALLVKARQKAEKNTLLFNIPKPIIIEKNGNKSAANVNYSLKGDLLKVSVTDLDKANFPISIDPSIYVVTAQQFMNGNNETNIDFDVDNKLIKKSPTTGARFDSWNSTTSIPTASWGNSSVAAGGYIYSIGGTSFSGKIYNTQGSDSFVVPNDITSITVKMWGGGGGGGAGGSAAAGGNGGASGYVTATIAVTPGETLNLYVGGGGGAGVRNTAGGAGGGGGYSSLYRGSTLLALVAGGGGGGGGRATSTHIGGAGGAGGGTTGIAGSGAGGTGTVVTGGGGGTQSSGGAAGTGGRNVGTAGTSLNGGLGANGSNSTTGANGGAANGGNATGGDGGSVTTTTYAAGGGGGSGYFGGGGGPGSTGTTITRGGSGGGGGSSYTIPSATSVTNTAGSGKLPGNSGDAYRNGAGSGGNAGVTANVGTAGASGLIAIVYGSGGTTVSSSVSWAKLNTTTGTVDSANPGSGTCSGWCTTAAYNLPSPRTNFTLTAYNGFLYAIGGIDNNGSRQNTVYIAKLGANGEPQLWHPTDKNKNNWTYWYQDANISSVRSDMSVVAYNNRMYLIGGRSTSGPVNTVEIADINPTGKLGTWTESTTLPYNLYGHTAQVYNDYLYIIGGASSVGGSPLNSTYYTKINNNGTINNWIQTTSFSTGRISNGGNFSVVWGAYIYVSGGCDSVNASGYCTSIRSDTQVASINADGSLDIWNNIGGANSQRMSFSMVAWRGYIYEVGGCSAQNTSTGDCNSSMSSDIIYGKINQDGDASTVDQSVASGTSPCSGTSPSGCNLPGTSYIGNMLNSSFITNGYLYVVGGCTNNGCSTTLGNIAYVAISSTGSMTKPATCPYGTYHGGDWCVDTTHAISGGLGSASPVVFGNRIYLVGGLDGYSNTDTIMRADLNNDGSISAWTTQTMTGLGVNSVSFLFAYARSNPSTASTIPGNLYIFGGCTDSTGAGCRGYSPNVYKCNIQISGAIAGCTTNGQLQIGTLPGDTAAGLGVMSGTVYANYIYLIGGVSPNQVDLTSLRYAKFDNNNNIVTAGGSNAWVESPNNMIVGRRRAAAFGYNGYIYVVGGYDGTAGVLADIEFIKVNVSDGSLGSSGDGFHVSAVTINQRWGLSVPVSNSFAYVIGGCTVGASPSGCTTRTDVVQTFQIYNNDSGAPAGYTTSANTYTTNPNRVGASSTIANGYIYVAGGCISTTDCTAATSNVSYASIDVNGNIGTWSSTTASLPHDLTGGKLESVGGSLYYIGGKKIEAAACSPTGESRFERYDGISGTSISDLYNSSSFPDSPSSTQTLNNLNLYGPSDIGDNFGGRLSAIICAPQTGDYTFWIASDDSSELRLSTDSSPANVSAIASVDGWTNANVWDTYPSQKSATISLVAGQSYYIEANYKEGTGGDHIEIGWQLPDNTYERPISNSRYMSPTTATISTPQSSIYYATPTSGNITSWNTTTNSLPATRTNFGSTVWNNRIYIVGGEGSGTGCTNNVCNSVYVSPQLNSGGNISSPWSTSSTPFSVSRSGTTAIAYANNLYILGGYNGANYLSDSQYSQINASNGQTSSWTYSASLPGPTSQASGFAANGYIYLFGGKSDATTCDATTLVAPISANTTITSGNSPTGIGEWYETNQRYTGDRYGASAVYNNGKAYVLGGACGSTLTYASPVVQQTTLLSQPQVAKYSIMIDTDSDVFPSNWLLNGVDNSIGAKWQLKYRSMTNTTTSCATSEMTTWGSDTYFGDVTLGLPGIYTPKDASGNNTNCARFYYFNVTVDSSQAYGYPDDVTRGPTITDLTLQFTADPSKRLMHGRTFTGGLQQPIDTPYYTN